jgi:hypothetical protein
VPFVPFCGLLLRRRATTSTALSRNPTQRDHCSTISSGESAGPRVLGPISSRVSCDGNLFTAFHHGLVDTTIEAIPIHHVWSRNLQCPIHSPALCVLCIEVDPAVRILQHDLRQLSNERERFALIVLRLKRVMGHSWNRSGEHSYAKKCGRDLVHRKPPETTFIVNVTRVRERRASQRR